MTYIFILQRTKKIINNEKEYNTSEKSGRYTVMKNDDISNKYYEKWSKIFTDLIVDEYSLKYPNVFTETKIRNLARENARYLLSIYTPASMQYTTSFRQLNYLYGFFQQEINNLGCKQQCRHKCRFAVYTGVYAGAGDIGKDRRSV